MRTVIPKKKKKKKKNAVEYYTAAFAMRCMQLEVMGGDSD